MSPVKCITLEEELKKNPELKLSDIQILKEWCKKQPHLPKIQDVELAIFLHSNYYHIEPTKSTIENYYTYRTHSPELFSNRDISKNKRLRDAFKVMAQLPLDRTTKEGYTIMVGHLLDPDPSHFFHAESVTASLMTNDEFVWTHGSTPGVINIFDASSISLGHMGRFNMAIAKKGTCYFQDTLPMRLKAMHVINMSSIFQKFYDMMKPFIKDEMINMTYFHSSLQSASKYFPVEALPNELGGKGGPIKELMDAQFKRIENFHEWFLNDEINRRVNESLRIGKSKTSSDLFGVEGSFRKMEID